jgi:UDP-N-acetylmuramoylalanine--D-glutamate ligase
MESTRGKATRGKAIVVGLGTTGQAVTRHLVAEGWNVVIVEDRADERTAEIAHRLGATLGRPGDAAGADMVVPSPGVGPDHPVHGVAAAAGVPVLSEVELAWRVSADTQLVAVTGTNGKTTVTTLLAAMLVESGRIAVAAGNIGLPFIEAVRRKAEVVVAEVSSFQLQYTEFFRPAVAVWLNMAEDHLDWHPTMEHYAGAKQRIWARQGPDDVAVVNAEDELVCRAAASAPGRVVTFGLGAGDYHLDGDVLRAPEGRQIMARKDLRRGLPHDVANALAATAAAEAVGVSLDACRAVLATFGGLPHRIQLVLDAGGVRYYDDSKATTPASVLAALRGFDSVVLIAGGRNKGLDLRVLRAEAHRLRAVVAIGEASSAVASAFEETVPVMRAGSMEAAVDAARHVARAGDVVVLSPGCASFDWYRSYAERGEDFVAAVRRLETVI